MLNLKTLGLPAIFSPGSLYLESQTEVKVKGVSYMGETKDTDIPKVFIVQKKLLHFFCMFFIGHNYDHYWLPVINKVLSVRLNSQLPYALKSLQVKL